MESGEACKGVGEAVEDDRTLTFELEAAEALAGLARSSSLPGEFERRRCQQVDSEAVTISSQYQALGGQQFSRKTSTMVAGPTNASKIVQTTPKQANNTSNLSKVPGTVRHNLTEAEKKAQRLRHLLANRESARQTIRCKQATYLELTGKAAKLSDGEYIFETRKIASSEEI